MGLRDLLCIPRKDRRARSQGRSNANSIEGSRVDLAALPHSEPDLRITHSALTPTPSTSRGREPDSMWAALFRVLHLTIFSPEKSRRQCRFRPNSIPLQ